MRIDIKTVCKKISIGFLLLLLGACGGMDKPYDLTSPEGPSAPPVINPPPPGPVAGLCDVKLTQVKVSVNGKGMPHVVGEDASGSGIFSSPPNLDFPDIPFTFNAHEVKLKEARFPKNAKLTLSGVDINVRMASGSEGLGTYDPDTRNIILNDVQFEIQNQFLGDSYISLGRMLFKTDLVEIQGVNGPASETGRPINPSDKTVVLVGGVRVPDTFGTDGTQGASLRGAAMLITFSGVMEKIPDGAPCTDNGSGVGIVELAGSGGDARELPFGTNNTLGIGSVFVPERGVDSPLPTDERFTKIKHFRIKNYTTQSISGSFDNRDGFVFNPAGAFTVNPNQSKDFEVKFSKDFPQDYSLTTVPLTQDKSYQVTVGGIQATFVATAKRASPELVVTGTEENARSTIDFKNVPAKVVGTGPNTRLQCNAQTVPSYLSHKLTIENRGIRPLQITKITRPKDAVDQNPDPGCVSGYGGEFIRLKPEGDGGATCQQFMVNGRSYTTDNCNLPAGTGKLSFKVVYFPVNASSLANAQNGTPQQDAATLDIENNDPAYANTQHKYTLNLTAAVSADRSDAMSLSRAIGTNPASLSDSNKVIRQDGLTRINIPNASDADVTQYFYLRNYSTDVLNIRSISVEGENAANFEVLTTPSVVPSGDPGKAVFGIKFTKHDLTHAAAKLKVTFRSGTVQADNIFNITLNGTVNRPPLSGRMHIRALAYNVLVGNSTAGVVNSEDYRTRMGRVLNQSIQPGPITVDFQTLGEGSDSNVKKVVVEPALGDEAHRILPSNENLLEDLNRLGPADRAKLFRFYSTRATRADGADVHDQSTGDIVCHEPVSTQGAFNTGDCGYFYYIFAQKDGKPGYYDDESGELIMPDLDLKMLLPYHGDIGAQYPTNTLSVMELHGSMTTLAIDSYSVNNFPGAGTDPLMLVSNGIDFEVPANYPPGAVSGAEPLRTHHDTKCPENWDIKNFQTATDLPKIGCFVTNSVRPFLKGNAFQQQEDGTYIGTLVMLVKFEGDGATYGNPPKPQNIPFFFKDSRMWMSFVAVLEPAPEEH